MTVINDNATHSKLIDVCNTFQFNDRNGTFEDMPDMIIEGEYSYIEAVEILLKVLDSWRDDAVHYITGELDKDTQVYYDELEQQTRDILKA